MRFPLETLPQALAAILLGALIVILLRVGGRLPENRALAAFFGATFLYDAFSVAGNAATDAAAIAALSRVGFAIGLADAVLLVGFAAVYLRVIDARPAPRFWPYAGGAATLVGAVLILPGDLGTSSGTGLTQSGQWLSLLDQLLDCAWVIVPIVLVRKAFRAPEDDPRWRSTLLLAGGIAMLFASFDIPGVVDGLALVGSIPPGLDGAMVVVLILRAVTELGLIAGLVVASARATAARARIAVTTALLIASGALAGLLGSVVWVRTGASSGIPAFAYILGFLLEPLVVAYTLLRHQLLGIDLRVKIGISRGALAAIFLAIFFVVTQIAQNYLQGYGVLAGGIAAGLMLFAIAPLQRIAERVADTAMPGVGDRRDPTSCEVAFKHALRFALSEGGVTREEELQLAHLADELGLSAQAATRLRHEVEAERRPGAAAPAP